MEAFKFENEEVEVIVIKKKDYTISEEKARLIAIDLLVEAN